LPIWKMADLFTPSIALGLFFARIGCFMAGCCYGRECGAPLGVVFESQYAHDLTGIPLGKALYPVQLFESGLNFLNFLILFLILRRRTFDGQVFTFYIMNYSLIRFFTEYFRGDHEESTFLIQGGSPFLSLTMPQFFCIVGVGCGLILHFWLKRKKSA